MADLDDVLTEFGVRVVGDNAPRRSRETHAARTLQKLFDRHGPDHVRDVLTSILESENNRHALLSAVIGGVSDVHRAHGAWFEADASAWLSVFDGVNLLEVYEAARARRGIAPLRAQIAVALSARLSAVFAPPSVTLFSHPEETV